MVTSNYSNAAPAQIIRKLETNELDLVSGGQDAGVIDLPLGCGSSIRLFVDTGHAMYIPSYPDKCPS
jgi:hypothetical protein